MQSNLTIVDLFQWYLFITSSIFLPILCLGTLRKTKARMQNRIGAPLWQPFYDLRKLFGKQETVSDTTSWLFRSNAAIGLATMLLLATLIPWLCWKPICLESDLFLVIYLFALNRFFAILAALDSASPFGAFGSSRDATVSMLVEPASLLSLVALSLMSRNCDLNVIFSFSNSSLQAAPGLWVLVGSTILLSSLVELSRMPVDDPTTHLELTMIHEAMILEASGRNLFLTEYARALRMTILFGLSAQCFLRAVPAFWTAPPAMQVLSNILAILAIAFLVGLFESVAVKLQWRKVPEFISYCMTFSLLAGLVAVARGMSL